jgi:Zinc carboxypeptidase
MGNAAPDAPAVGFFGGVHGLERIGTQVLLSFLGSLVTRLHWDEVLHRQLDEMRLVFMPLVNPSGMARRTRANARGVDLMRNSPVQSGERVAFLVGGQRVSARLPWYRGAAGAPMERESRAVCEVVRDELLSRPFSLALDCHSGFGMRDRIWFPHACTRAPFAHAAEVHALVALFESLYPAHAYVFEPQCRQYLAHGDLWDFLWLEARPGGGMFLPLTLEMGSWRWVRKSPRQILSRLGIFNPLPPDRLQRVRRNHLLWMGFLCRAAHAWREWVPTGERREKHERAALSTWFGRAA